MIGVDTPFLHHHHRSLPTGNDFRVSYIEDHERRGIVELRKCYRCDGEREPEGVVGPAISVVPYPVYVFFFFLKKIVIKCSR